MVELGKHFAHCLRYKQKMFAHSERWPQDWPALSCYLEGQTDYQNQPREHKKNNSLFSNHPKSFLSERVLEKR